MTNELLLIGTLIVLYGAVLLWFYLFGTGGLMAFTVFATIAANIEVLILIDAYGMEMTLGNILFATTFLVTDILSEVAGKKTAQQAVWAGISANVLFILVSQSWLTYIPSVNDWAMPSMKAIFSNPAHDAVVAGGVRGRADFRRMAVSQVVGNYRAQDRRPPRVPLAAQQRFDAGLADGQHRAVHRAGILGHL